MATDKSVAFCSHNFLFKKPIRFLSTLRAGRQIAHLWQTLHAARYWPLVPWSFLSQGAAATWDANLPGIVPEAPMGWSINTDPGPCGRGEFNEDRLRAIFRTIQSTGLDQVGFRTLVIENCWQAHPDTATVSTSTRDTSSASAHEILTSHASADDTKAPKPGSPQAGHEKEPERTTDASLDEASRLRGRNTRSAPLLADSLRFPRGLKPLTDELHAAGYILGVNLLLPSCFPPPAPSGKVSSQPEARSAEPVDEAALVHALYAEGIELVRVKSCLPEVSQRLRQYHRLSTALKQVSAEILKTHPKRRPIVLSLGDPEVFGLGAWSMDLASWWTFDGEAAKSWPVIFEQAAKTDRFSALTGRDHWNEPGPLWPIDRSWTWEQKKTQWYLWTMLGSPLLVPYHEAYLGRDVRRFVSHRSVMSIYLDHIGLQAVPLQRTPETETWVKPLSRPGHRALLFANKTDKIQRVSLKLAQLGIESPFTLREVISQNPVPLSPGDEPAVDQELAPFGSLFLTVSGQEQKPLSSQGRDVHTSREFDIKGKKETVTAVSLTQRVPVYAAGIIPTPATVAKIRYSQALAVGVPSVVRYFTGGQCQRFQSLVGLEDQSPPETPAHPWIEFEVWADGLRLFSSRRLNPKNPVTAIDMKLDGVNYLDLVTLGGGLDFERPTGQWIYPTLQCAQTP